MGAFVDGTWREGDFPHDTTGHFVRPDAPFRNWVTASGEAGPSGAGGFKAEPDRYHLIISLACPWAHRTLIFRRLKGLESMISLSVVHWLLAERGWTFDAGPGVIPDPIFGASELREFYVKARPDYSGRVTVPVLWDKTDEHDRQQRIVGNHPHVQQRLRWGRRGRGRLLSERPAAGDRRGQRRASIERSTMASIAPVSPPRRKLTKRRSGSCSRRSTGSRRGSPDQRFLIGQRLTEADWRLFTTLIRFDPVYFGHFKCNLREIRNYPALSRYLKGALPPAGHRRDGRLLPHQAPLLREPPAHQSDRHRAGRAGTRAVRQATPISGPARSRSDYGVVLGVRADPKP